MSDDYRILGPDEVIREGDEIDMPNGGAWAPCKETIGGTPKQYPGTFRRKVEPVAKNTTTECPACGKESHPMLTCEQFEGVSKVAEQAAINQLKKELDYWKQRAEKAEAKLEGLEFHSELVRRLQQAERERDEALDGRKHTQEWYAVRDERMDEWMRSEAPHDVRKQYFAIKANGCSTVNDPPKFARLLNAEKFEREKAEKERDEAVTSAKAFQLSAKLAIAERDQLCVERDEARRFLELRTASEITDEITFKRIQDERDQLRSEAEQLRQTNVNNILSKDDEIAKLHAENSRLEHNWKMVECRKDEETGEDLITVAGHLAIYEAKAKHLQSENDKLRTELDNTLSSESAKAIEAITISRLTEALLSDKPEILPDGLKTLPAALKEIAKLREALGDIAKGFGWQGLEAFEALGIKTSGKSTDELRQALATQDRVYEVELAEKALPVIQQTFAPKGEKEIVFERYIIESDGSMRVENPKAKGEPSPQTFNCPPRCPECCEKGEKE